MKPLAEQVAELERERDRLKDVAVELEQKRSEMQRRLWVQEGYTHDERQRAERAEASLASAKVEGAREALTRYAEKYCDAFDSAHMFRFRDREYPAVPEGVDGFTGHAATSGTFSQTVCVIPNCDCAHAHPTPTPEREGYEGPIVALSLTEMSDGGEKLLITPADARRIVSLAAQDGGSV